MNQAAVFVYLQEHQAHSGFTTRRFHNCTSDVPSHGMGCLAAGEHDDSLDKS